MPWPLLIPLIGSVVSAGAGLFNAHRARQDAEKQNKRMEEMVRNSGAFDKPAPFNPDRMTSSQIQELADIDRANQVRDNKAGRYNMSGVFGSSGWNGDTFENKLSPNEQAKYNAQGRMLPTLLGNFGNGDTSVMASRMYNNYMNRMRPEFDQQISRAQNTLIQQGFAPDSRAYRSEMDRISRNQNQQLLDAQDRAEITSSGVNSQNIGAALNLYNNLTPQNPMNDYIPSLGGTVANSYANAQNINQNNVALQQQAYQNNLDRQQRAQQFGLNMRQQGLAQINQARGAIPSMIGDIIGQFARYQQSRGSN